MSNIFHQSKALSKVFFNTYFENIEQFESILPDEIAGFSTYEVKSDTVESKPDDLWCVEILIADNFKPENIASLIKNFAINTNLYIEEEICYEKLEEKDWVAEYQKQIKPLIIENFFISNKSHLESCPKTSIPICIESSRAFGTGEHETTTGCIQALNSLNDLEVRTVFDLGTGTGILSFVAEKIWPEAKIAACDIDEISVMVAKNNMKFNNSAINFFQNSHDNLNLPKNFTAPFDIVVSNILAGPLVELAPTIKAIIHKGSYVILSGFLDYQTESVIKEYNQKGFYVHKEIIINKWVTLTCKVKSN